MKLRALLLTAGLSTAALIGTSPAQAAPACTHADGLVSVNVCADPAAKSATVTVCTDVVRMACRDIGTR